MRGGWTREEIHLDALAVERVPGRTWCSLWMWILFGKWLIGIQKGAEAWQREADSLLFSESLRSGDVSDPGQNEMQLSSLACGVAP